MEKIDLILSYISESLTKRDLSEDTKQNFDTVFNEVEKQKILGTVDLLMEKYVSPSIIENRIALFNEVILRYAQHDYGTQVNSISNNDYFDSLVTSINYLGEELNYSTVSINYLQDIFNSIDDILLIVDKNGKIESVNSSGCLKLGYEENYLIGKPITKIFLENIDINTYQNRNFFQSHFHIFTRDKKTEPVLLSISPFVQGDGKIIGSIVIVKNINDFLKYQKEIENQNAEIKRINKMLTKHNMDLIIAKNKAEESERLKAAFLANVSHEIRTPMNSIIGFSDLLAMSDSELETDVRHRYLKIIKDNTRQLLSIIDDIVDISKIEANQVYIIKKPASINNILKEVYYSFTIHEKVKQGRVNLEIENNLPEGMDSVIIDKFRVKQILNNLLSNAFKFTEKGLITIRCELFREKEILFSVHDSGIGISKKKQDVIFGRFKQAENGLDRKYGGTGLGLSISKALVELMNGTIWVESTIKKGSGFYFSLPYEKAERYSAKKIMPSINEITRDWSDKHILIVEDNPVNRLFYEKALARTNAKIHSVESGEDAIAYCAENKDIDVILMDIQLPKMDGVEATKRIRMFNFDAIIIAQTANVLMDNIKELTEKAGCNDFITKPIKLTYLLDMIDYYFSNK